MRSSLRTNNIDGAKEGLLSFQGDMTMMHALEIKKDLLEATGEADILQLDLHEIESVDVSFVQLICAAHRECASSGKKISLQIGSSEPVKELFNRAGYSKQFGCPAAYRESCVWKSLES